MNLTFFDFLFHEFSFIKILDEVSKGLLCEEEIVVEAEQSKHTLDAINEQLSGLPLGDEDLEIAEQSVDDLMKAMQEVEEALERQKVKIGERSGRFGKNPEALQRFEELKEKQKEIKALLEDKVSSVSREKGSNYFL